LGSRLLDDPAPARARAEVPLYVSTARKLRRKVLGAKPGEKLSEWALARQFGISRSWLRHCVRDLVEEGLLTRSPGRGTFVTGKAAALSAIRQVSSSHAAFLGLDSLAVEKLRADYPNVRLETMPYSGSPADVRCVISHAVPFYAHLHQPIAPILERYPELDPKNFRTDALEIFRHEGEILALPLVYSAAVLHFNPALLEKAGLAQPSGDWSWEDLLGAARAAHRPDENRLGIGIPELARFFSALVRSYGGEICPGPRGRWDLTHEAAYRAASLFAALRPFSVLVDERSSAYDMARTFAEGRIAMFVVAGVLPIWLNGRTPGWIGRASLPKGETWATWFMAEGIGLGSDCRNVDLASAFIRELVCRSAQVRLIAAGFASPAWRDVGGPEVEQSLYHTQKRHARVTYHLYDAAYRSILETQLRRLDPATPIEEFCRHTEDLLNAVVRSRRGSPEPQFDGFADTEEPIL